MFSKLTKTGVASLIVGAAASTALLSAAPANASQSLTKQLVAGESLCVEQYAGYQVRVDGSSKKPLHFRVFRNGAAIQSYPGSYGFINEWRTSTGTFPGPGYYKVCAVNNTTVGNQATVNIRTDAEL